MPGLGPGSHQFSRKVLRRRWITGSSPVTTISRRVPILIRRNPDQAAGGIPAIERARRAAGALFCPRTFLDRHAARGQMRHHLFRRAGGEKAQIVAARGFMIRREPLDLVGIAWPHIDLLMAEHQRRPWRLARTRIENPDLHAEAFL